MVSYLAEVDRMRLEEESLEIMVEVLGMGTCHSESEAKILEVGASMEHSVVEEGGHREENEDQVEIEGLEESDLAVEGVYSFWLAY